LRASAMTVKTSLHGRSISTSAFTITAAA
jgi:hypothetical protein